MLTQCGNTTKLKQSGNTYFELFQIGIDIFDKDLDGLLQVDKSSFNTVKVSIYCLYCEEVKSKHQEHLSLWTPLLGNDSNRLNHSVAADKEINIPAEAVPRCDDRNMDRKRIP